MALEAAVLSFVRGQQATARAAAAAACASTGAAAGAGVGGSWGPPRLAAPTPLRGGPPGAPHALSPARSPAPHGPVALAIAIGGGGGAAGSQPSTPGPLALSSGVAAAGHGGGGGGECGGGGGGLARGGLAAIVQHLYARFQFLQVCCAWLNCAQPCVPPMQARSCAQACSRCHDVTHASFAHATQGIYRAHSKSEDEIVFPALEAKQVRFRHASSPALLDDCHCVGTRSAMARGKSVL
jgi:hypothetical protein